MQKNMPHLYDEDYFQTRGSVMCPSSVFKSYAVYIAQSRPGHISGKIAISSLIGMLEGLWRQIERHRRCQLIRADKGDVRNFVRTGLKEQEGLATAMHVKPLAMAEDTSYVFSVLYSAAYLPTFCDIRIVFNITLFIKLMVDAANRGGDMLDNPGKSHLVCFEKYFWA
jgi:hypothetical protein